MTGQWTVVLEVSEDGIVLLPTDGRPEPTPIATLKRKPALFPPP